MDHHTADCVFTLIMVGIGILYLILDEMDYIPESFKDVVKFIFYATIIGVFLWWFIRKLNSIL